MGGTFSGPAPSAQAPAAVPVAQAESQQEILRRRKTAEGRTTRETTGAPTGGVASKTLLGQ